MLSLFSYRQKRRKLKKGEQDDNNIAQAAASSLLALVNVPDKSNKFNQLDEMQNHMSKLITKQKGKVMDDYVVAKEANKEDLANQDAINKKIEDYRESLMLFSFEQSLLKRNLDSLVTQENIATYYETNKNNFKLRENVLKAQFVVVKNETPQKENLKAWLKDTSEAGQKQLQEYCLKYAVNYSLSPSWYVFNSFISEIPIETDNVSDFLKIHKIYQTKDAVNTYVVKIVDYGVKGKTAPMSFETENITKLLLNKRKMEYNIYRLKNGQRPVSFQLPLKETFVKSKCSIILINYI